MSAISRMREAGTAVTEVARAALFHDGFSLYGGGRTGYSHLGRHSFAPLTGSPITRRRSEFVELAWTAVVQESLEWRYGVIG